MLARPAEGRRTYEQREIEVVEGAVAGGCIHTQVADSRNLSPVGG